MSLVCPNCGSNEIVYAGTTASKDQTYKCRKCKYTGPLAIDTGNENLDKNTKDFPYLIIAGIAFISTASYGMGVSLINCALFFAIPTSLLLGFHYFVKEEDRGGVEKDLENLGEDGEPKEFSVRRV